MSQTDISDTRIAQPRVPPGPRGHFLLGIVRDVQKDFLATTLQLHREYGDLVRYRFGCRYGYQVNHPAYIQHVLHDNHRNYRKSKAAVSRLELLGGNGLLTSDGELWQRQRRLIQPAFHRQRIAALGTVMTGATELMLEQWRLRDQQPIDVSTEMMQLTLRIAGESLFGLDLIDKARDVGQAFADVSNELTNFPTLYLLLRTLLPGLSLHPPPNQRFDVGLRKLEAVVQGIIDQRRSHGDDADDVLSMLMTVRDEATGECMDDPQLRDEVMTLLLAGHETTSLALTWTWYLLSHHPEVEHRLHTELDHVLSGRTPTATDLPRLPYTRQVIEETLRLYPPAHAFTRQALANDVIGGYHIPTGAHLLMQPYIVHRHLAFWDNPEAFDPDRFTPEQTQTRHRYAYIPFGGGPRLCIGSNFAMTEAQLVLATVAQRYQLRIVPGHPVELEPLITLRPRHGIRMTLQRRL